MSKQTKVMEYKPLNEESKFISCVYHLQQVKRWAEYSPYYLETSASNTYRAVAYAVIGTLVETEIFNNEIDKFTVVGKCLLGDLKSSITGSVKHRTKKNPMVSPFIKEAEKAISNQLVNYIFSPAMREKLNKLIVNAEDDTKEGRFVQAINTFSSMMYCYREYLTGINPFFAEKFEELYEELKRSDIDAIQWLLMAFDEKGDMFDLLQEINELSTIERWNTRFNLLHDNDSSHTFRAACLGLFFALREQEQSKKDVDLFRLISKIAFHDIPETITGDVKGTLKHDTKESSLAWGAYEKAVAEAMISRLPIELQPFMQDYLADAKDDSFEGYLVEASDKLDALIKAKLEKIINPSYDDVYDSLLQGANRKFADNPSIKYFLDEILPGITFYQA